MKAGKIFVKPSMISGEVKAPPSKSYTHRALAAALLAEGESTILNPLISRDTKATIRACSLLGARIIKDKDGIRIQGGAFKTPEDVIDVENSGTTLRFFTAISALAPRGYTILTGDESIRKRPMQPLLDSLRNLGVECWSSRLNGYAPIIVKGGGLRGGETRIRGDISSQYISALLYASTKSEEGVRVIVEDEIVSRPYIDATIAVLESFGFKVKREDYRIFEIEGGQVGRSTMFKVPGDLGSAAFLMAGAHLTGGELLVNGVDLSMPQADAEIIKVLQRLGSKVSISSSSVRIFGSGEVCGGGFDLMDAPDLLPIVAVMAAKSPSETIIRGVGHARFKESDRISAMASELRKLGVEVEELPDGMRIVGREKLRGGCVLESHGDHRIFMALTILAASTEQGCIVNGADLADISYPSFLNDAKTLGLRFEFLED